MDTIKERAPKRDLLERLEAQRAHVTRQLNAMSPSARRTSWVPSGWTPRGLVRHLTLDVERVWLLAGYARECGLASAVVADLDLGAAPTWWFDDAGAPPYSSLEEAHVPPHPRSNPAGPA